MSTWTCLPRRSLQARGPPAYAPVASTRARIAAGFSAPTNPLSRPATPSPLAPHEREGESKRGQERAGATCPAALQQQQQQQQHTCAAAWREPPRGALPPTRHRHLRLLPPRPTPPAPRHLRPPEPAPAPQPQPPAQNHEHFLPRPSTLDPRPSTLDPRPSTLDPPLWYARASLHATSERREARGERREALALQQRGSPQHKTPTDVRAASPSPETRPSIRCNKSSYSTGRLLPPPLCRTRRRCPPRHTRRPHPPHRLRHRHHRRHHHPRQPQGRHD